MPGAWVCWPGECLGHLGPSMQGQREHDLAHLSGRETALTEFLSSLGRGGKSLLPRGRLHSSQRNTALRQKGVRG